MKKVAVVGIGLGKETLTADAKQAVKQAEVLLGAPRMLEMFSDLAKPSYPHYLPADAAKFIAEDKAQSYAVLVSGDVGFYSAAAKMQEALMHYDVYFVPGISTVNAFFAKLKLPWQEAVFVSAHGREVNIADTVRRNRLTFCLTGNNVNKIGYALCKAGFSGIKVYAGENLETKEERIYETVPEGLSRGEFPALTVLLFINEAFDNRMLCGIPDSSFFRLPKIPMTKSETRAVIISKLCIRPDFVCWDVGSGTGSVAVEMALCAYNGHVYAAEKRKSSIPLIEKNFSAFHVGNASVVQGEAPEVLEALPLPDAVFIGGSGGELSSIAAVILKKNPAARIVVTAVTIETAALALDVFSRQGLEPEIVQLNVSRGKLAGKSHLMEAQNPVTIISTGGRV